MSAADPAAARRGLERDLREKPYSFDFYQALRRLECVYRDQPRVGASRHAAEDPVRFAQEADLGFAPSMLASFSEADETRKARMALYSFGLLGPNGPLPIHLTEYARDRQRNSDDPTFIRFLDVFHHRMISFLYRAWASAQPTVNLDRPEDDRFALYVGSFFGLGLPAVRERDAMPDMAKLHHAGSFSNQTQPAEGLRSVLEDFFRDPIVLNEFVGQWLSIPEASRWRLGESPETGTLGRTATVGARVWECQRKFRISIGPMRLPEYSRLLPGSDSLDRLTAVVRNYTGDALMWDVKLILSKEDVPHLLLGGKGRLGLTTWLAGRPFQTDAADLTLDPMAREFKNV